MIATQTVDVTKKVSRYIKFSLIILLIFASALGFGVFHFQHAEDTMKITDAKVAGTLVSVRVLTDGKIRELTRVDGDQVQAGDVIAKLEVSVTEEQLQQLEQAVENAKANYAELEKGQMVKVEVRTPKQKTIVREQPPQVQAAPPRDLSALAERRDRMEKLYEMGAISRVQRDAAVQAYESAVYEASQPMYVESEPIVETEIEYEIEYVDQLQPTPPAILEGAQMAIKQAEMSLNTARQEAQQTEVTAPVSGTIYYNVSVNDEIEAGMPIAKIGDSNELWLEAEVSEDQFYRVSLGKLVDYELGGKNFKGTVIEKIAPIEYGVGGPYPILLAENDPPPFEPAIEPIEPIEQQTQSEAATETPAGQSSEQSTGKTPLDYTQVVDEPFQSPPPVNNSENYEPEPQPKFVVKFSLPTERDFDCRPNMTANVTVHDPLISWRWIKPMYRNFMAQLHRQLNYRSVNVEQ